MLAAKLFRLSFRNSSTTGWLRIPIGTADTVKEVRHPVGRRFSYMFLDTVRLGTLNYKYTIYDGSVGK